MQISMDACIGRAVWWLATFQVSLMETETRRGVGNIVLPGGPSSLLHTVNNLTPVLPPFILKPALIPKRLHHQQNMAMIYPYILQTLSSSHSHVLRNHTLVLRNAYIYRKSIPSGTSRRSTLTTTVGLGVSAFPTSSK